MYNRYLQHAGAPQQTIRLDSGADEEGFMPVDAPRAALPVSAPRGGSVGNTAVMNLLQGFLKRLRLAELALDDILLLAIVFLVLRQSEDDNLLLILAALFFVGFFDRR